MATDENRETWVLLALDAGRDKCLSPVQLQKSLFLLSHARQKEIGKGLFRFKPYHYGPFDVAVYEAADALAAHGLVHVEQTPGSYRVYRLTEAGVQQAEIRAEDEPQQAVDYLRRAVAFVESVPFDVLISTIYKAFPAMAKNSVFRGAN